MLALVGRQNVETADRAAPGSRDHRLQQPNEPRRAMVSTIVAVEQVAVDSRAAAAAARPAPPSGSAGNAWRRARLMSVSRRPPSARPRGCRGRPDSSRTPPGCRTARPIRPAPGSPQARDAGAPSGCDWPSCTSCSNSSSGLLAGSLIRSGSVLMNSPTMLSMPAISGGRPATVTPNTTSSRPVSRPSRMPQAAWTTVLSVRPCCARLPGERRGQRLAQRQRDLLGRDRHSPGLRAAPAGCACVQTRQAPPARPRSRRRGPARRSRPDNRGRASPAAARAASPLRA